MRFLWDIFLKVNSYKYMMKLEELFESDNQVLMELWDNPYPWHVSQFRDNEFFFEAPYTDKNGKYAIKYIAVSFASSSSFFKKITDSEADKELLSARHVMFGTINKDDDKNPTPARDYMSFEAMNDSNGNYRTFTTIAKICESYFKNNLSKVIKFSGTGPSRVKLYARLSRVMASKLRMTVYTDIDINYIKTIYDGADFILIDRDLAKIYRPSDTRYRLL